MRENRRRGNRGFNQALQETENKERQEERSCFVEARNRHPVRSNAERITILVGNCKKRIFFQKSEFHWILQSLFESEIITAGKMSNLARVETNVGRFLGKWTIPPVRNVGCLPETKAIYIFLSDKYTSRLKSWDGIFIAGQMLGLWVGAVRRHLAKKFSAACFRNGKS